MPAEAARPARALLSEAVHRAGVPAHEAEWLLCHLTGQRRSALLLNDPAIEPAMAGRFFRALDERRRGVPLQYLLGETEFFGLAFKVTPDVLIPRPETEVIVQAALQRLKPASDAGKRLKLLDLGTGSGCIAVALAVHLPACLVLGLDVSYRALRVAKANAAKHGVASRVQVVQGCWIDALRGPCDAVVCNPPYVPSSLVDRLPLDVRQEPRMSLDGGPDGLRDLSHVLFEAPGVLADGGWLFLECGEDQPARLAQRAGSDAWSAIETLTDLAGKPRGLALRRQVRR